MVAEIRDDHESEWAAMTQVAELLGVGSAETVRKWCRQAEATGIQALEDAERVYYQARYEHVILGARLKAAAGVISVADILAINQLLTGT